MSRLTKKDCYGHWYTNEKINDRMQADEPYPHAYDGKPVDKLAYYEDKQEQGLLIELPVPIGGTVWGWEYSTRIDEEDGSTWTICDIRRAKVVSKKFHLMMLDKMGDMYFATEAEAEEALAKMGGANGTE